MSGKSVGVLVTLSGPVDVSSPDFGVRAACLVMAGLCLLVALRYIGRALAPVAPLIGGALAALVVASAVGSALIFVLLAIAVG